jgi:hypothetical protein
MRVEDTTFDPADAASTPLDGARVEESQPAEQVNGALNCVAPVVALRKEFHRDEVRPGRTVDESVLVDPGAVARLTPAAAGLGRRSPTSLRVRSGPISGIGVPLRTRHGGRVGPGRAVYVLMRRSAGEGHAFALRHTVDGDLSGPTLNALS